jgi:hypothetical protein
VSGTLRRTVIALFALGLALPAVTPAAGNQS